ncbi:LamG domain-containing protein [Brumicola pallidula]|uniref:ATPase n=1 Tax=Brumicola pallidula DSM 14239 = ACAM 615 TaxID=1121922 RepID=K6Z1V5_9ALTE|nr:LamG domain-containing protein [Glaciecola pallidula]GAC30196.1 ATPase [Glaciecola pallidula DSM 14239 = ACAM 615]
MVNSTSNSNLQTVLSKNDSTGTSMYSQAVRHIGAASIAILLLASCGGGSDAIVEPTPLPPPVQQPTLNYTGPAPATTDVQNFKLALWDNLAKPDRCGACHIQDQQSPPFARFDDINLAYTEVNGLINTSRIADSALVTKVAGGHNCWLSDASACADIISAWIGNWVSTEQVETSIELNAPVVKIPGANKNFPADSGLFESNVYPVLRAHCVDCHQSSAAIPISPYLASSDIAEAYAAATSKMNLDLPEDSRIVARLRDEFHNCWTDNCQADGQALADAIQAMADAIDVTELDANLVSSNALTLFDGTLATGGGRFESNLIAKWEFKTASGNIAFDTSGVEPALNLTLSGAYEWVGGNGIQLTDGKAQGSTTDSKKVHDLIVSTGEFAIEAWVAPANVTQEGPARIVSYSGGRDRRNFTLGQTLYNYDMLLRHGNTDTNGMPALSTRDADEDLQAALQHVVVNYDGVGGRQIYVNGESTDDHDTIEAAGLGDWDDSFAFVLGNEVSGDVPWAGTIRMAAMHNRVLTSEQIVKNFDAGVGEKFFLLFGVSEIINVPQSYIVFEVSQFDSYSYLFTEPSMISLDANANLDGITLTGIRIGVNGRESRGGQVFATLNLTVDGVEAASNDLGQQLSAQGTIIPVQKGPVQDEFFLTFEVFGDAVSLRPTADMPLAAQPVDLAPQSDIGIRNFAEVNASMAALTGVSSSQVDVNASYQQLRQQLPSITDMQSFLASNQMAITQMAIRYCDVMVEDNSLRASYFPQFDFNKSANESLGTNERAALVNPLIDRMIGSGLSSQPASADVSTELNNLIDRLTTCSNSNSCSAQTIPTVAKATCAAVLGSAAVVMQ